MPGAPEPASTSQPEAEPEPEAEPKPTRVEAMRAKLKAGGHASPYRLRKQLPEPVFGQIKQARGFRPNGRWCAPSTISSSWLRGGLYPQRRRKRPKKPKGGTKTVPPLPSHRSFPRAPPISR